MLAHVVAVLALGALCAVWVWVQQTSGCENAGSCRSCTCKKAEEPQA